MAKYFLPIFFSLIFISCNSTLQVDQEKESVNEVDSERYEIPEHHEAEHHYDPISITNFLKIPFTVATTTSENKWIKKDSIHPVTGDTLTTKTYGESIFHIFNHHYIDATILDSDLHIANDIAVGMSKKEFKSRFINFKESANEPYVNETDYVIILSLSSNLETNDRWEFSFDRDTLEMIQFDHYIDTDIGFSKEAILPQ